MSVDSWCSGEWFEYAATVAADSSFKSVDLTVEYRCVEGSGLFVHHQIFESGRLVCWQRGPADTPDVVLRQPLSFHLAMLTRAELGNDLLLATEVIDIGSGESLWPPPLDEVMVGWGAELPLVPAAGEFVVQQVMTGSPFGTVDVFARLREGRVVESGGGSPGNPDVVVRRPFGAALRHRAGDLDALASVEDGEVLGDFRVLAVFLGIFDAEECVESRRKLTTPYCEPLIRLGEILCSPGWRAVASRISGPALGLRSVP